jgi:hypothetical protein
MLYHEEYNSPKPDRYMNIELKFENNKGYEVY